MTGAVPRPLILGDTFMPGKCQNQHLYTISQKGGLANIPTWRSHVKSWGCSYQMDGVVKGQSHRSKWMHRRKDEGLHTRQTTKPYRHEVFCSIITINYFLLVGFHDGGTFEPFQHIFSSGKRTHLRPYLQSSHRLASHTNL